MFQRRIDWTDPDGIIIAQLASKNYADLKDFVFMNRSENIKMLLKRILHDIVPNIQNAEPVGKSDNRTLKDDIEKTFYVVTLNDLKRTLEFCLLLKKNNATKKELYDLKKELASYRIKDEAVKELVVSNHP